MIKEEDISVDVWQNGEEMITIHCDNWKIIKQEILNNQEKAKDYDKMNQQIYELLQSKEILKEEIRQLKCDEQDHADCRKEINRLKSRYFEISQGLRDIITKRNLELKYCKHKINILGGKNVK